MRRICCFNKKIKSILNYYYSDYRHHNYRSIIEYSITSSSRKTSSIMEIEECHKKACDAKENLYIDPITGLYVMTEYNLNNRGICCGNGCRHCPYGHFHVNVNASRGGGKIRCNKLLKPTILKIKSNSKGSELIIENKNELFFTTITILFWSGGKYSYLALVYLFELYQRSRNIVLLSTFDESNGNLSHQNLSIECIMDQAKHLQLDLLAVPLPSNCSNEIYLSKILEAIEILKVDISLRSECRTIGITPCNISTIAAFGDPILNDITAWKTSVFENRNPSSSQSSSSCIFPLVGIDRNDLIAKLESHKYDASKMSGIGKVNVLSFKSIEIIAGAGAGAEGIPPIEGEVEGDDVKESKVVKQKKSFVTFEELFSGEDKICTKIFFS